MFLVIAIDDFIDEVLTIVSVLGIAILDLIFLSHGAIYTKSRKKLYTLS